MSNSTVEAAGALLRALVVPSEPVYMSLETASPSVACASDEYQEGYERGWRDALAWANVEDKS